MGSWGVGRVSWLGQQERTGAPHKIERNAVEVNKCVSGNTCSSAISNSAMFCAYTGTHLPHVHLDCKLHCFQQLAIQDYDKKQSRHAT